ncbi:MAG: hypothetical protein JWN87_3139 [Frankiales bacterium]|jgi:hypothetical protein|nr:hypothetical protein [Frankiales bacterium]
MSPLAVVLALLLSGPALLLVVQGNLDVSSAAVRFVVALMVSGVVLRVVGAALRPADDGEPQADPAAAEDLPRRRSSDHPLEQSGAAELPEDLMAAP